MTDAPSPADPAFLAVEALTCRYGSVTAVRGVSLAVAQGSFFALIGPSGCGKTTLLRALGGFEVPTAGRIVIDGRDHTATPPWLRPVNMVFQSYAIFPHLSVRRNIAYGLRTSGLGRAAIEAKVDDALRLIHLEGLGDRRADQLSRGQRQRVALARALVKEPKVLLLDEPLGALDRQLREHMQFELRQLQRRLGITFVLVIHDQDEALTMADQVAVMQDGRIVEAGPPQHLYARPRTRFVAEFLGQMNIIAAQAAAGAVTLPGFGAVPVAPPAILPPGAGTVTCAIRPERLSLAPGGGPAAAARVVSAAFLGDRMHVFCAIDGWPAPVIVSVPGRDAAAVPGPGAAVTVTLDPAHLLVLDDGPAR